MNRVIYTKFHHFLKDKKVNLEKRWEFFISENPEWTERKLGFTPLIIKNGWAVIYIPKEDKEEPEFAYTIGLFYNYNHPELMMIGAHLSAKEYQAVLNAFGTLIKKGDKVEAGKDYKEVIEMKDQKLVFKKATKEVLGKYPFGYGGAFYTNFTDTDKNPPILYIDFTSGQ